MTERAKLIVVLVSIVFLLSNTALLAQSRRVVVVKPSEAELRRTAARLRTCPEQVQNIRQVLSEAAELLPDSVSGPGNFTYQLFRFNRPQAEETVAKLVEQFASRARQTSNHLEYQRLRTQAFEMIESVQRYNPTLAAQLEDQFPENQFQESTPGLQDPRGDFFAQQEILRLARRDPEEALRRLSTLEPSAAYMARSALANALFDKGMETEARRLVDQTLSAPLGPMSPANATQLAQFARSAFELFPDYADRIQGAIATAYQSLVQAGDSASRPFTLPNGQTIQVNQADQFLVSQIMSMNSDQQFAAGLVELSPNISEKVRSAGGYSAFFRFNQRQWRQSQQKLAAMPDDQLESKFQDSSATDLARSASQACYEFPEKAEKIFDLALRKLQAETEPLRAVNDFQNLSTGCARCLGELPEKWLSAGRELLEKVRQKEQEMFAGSTNAGLAGPPARMRGSSRLESLLLAFKAQTDFAGAMQDARAIEDKSARFEVLMRIAQHLGNR